MLGTYTLSIKWPAGTTALQANEYSASSVLLGGAPALDQQVQHQAAVRACAAGGRPWPDLYFFWRSPMRRVGQHAMVQGTDTV